MTQAIFYDRINQAIQGLTNQLNVNATHDLQREQLGMQRLKDTQDMMLKLEQNRRANEFQQVQMDVMKSSEARAKAAESRAVQQFNMSIPGLKFNMMRAQNAITSTDVNVGKWFTANPYLASELKSNPSLQKDIASIFGSNVSLDPKTLNIIKSNGKPLKLSGYDQSNKGIQLLGVIESHLDPMSGLEHNQAQLQQNLSNLQKQYKNVNDRDAATKASIASEIAKTKMAIGKYGEQFNPVKLLDFYRRKGNLLRTAATIASTSGGEPAYINLLSNAMAQNSNRMGELQKEILKSMGAGGDSGKNKQQRTAVLVDDNGNMIPKSMVVLNTPKAIPSGMIPATVDPTLKGYVWADELQLGHTLKSGSGSDKTLSEDQALKKLDSFYGPWDADRGQYAITKDLEDQRTNAVSYFNDVRKNEPNTSMLSAVMKSRNWASALDNEYKKAHVERNQYTYQSVENELRERGKPTDPDTVNRAIVNLHKQIDDWYLGESYVKNRLPKREITELEQEALAYIKRKKRK